MPLLWVSPSGGFITAAKPQSLDHRPEMPSLQRIPQGQVLRKRGDRRHLHQLRWSPACPVRLPSIQTGSERSHLCPGTPPESHIRQQDRQTHRHHSCANSRLRDPPAAESEEHAWLPHLPRLTGLHRRHSSWALPLWHPTRSHRRCNQGLLPNHGKTINIPLPPNTT